MQRIARSWKSYEKKGEWNLILYQVGRVVQAAMVNPEGGSGSGNKYTSVNAAILREMKQVGWGNPAINPDGKDSVWVVHLRLEGEEYIPYKTYWHRVPQGYFQPPRELTKEEMWDRATLASSSRTAQDSGDLRDLVEVVKDEYRRFDHEVEALDERAVTLDVTGLDTSGSPFKAELTVYPAQKSLALRFEGDSNAKRLMKPEDLSNLMPTVKKLWWAKEARVSNTLAEKVAARFLAASRSKQAGWDGKLVGKDFRMTWDQSGIHIEELPAKGKRKLRVAEMLTPFMWTKFDAWLPVNLIESVGKVSASDSYDTAKAKVEAALTDKRTLEWVQKDAAPGVDPLKLLKDYRTQWSERQVHFLQITPENVEPFTADGKDFTVSCEWTKFKAYSPDSDLGNAGDPYYSIIVSSAAASARKLYQILKAEPNALKSIPWSKFSDFLRANKINYEMQHSVWH